MAPVPPIASTRVDLRKGGAETISREESGGDRVESTADRSASHASGVEVSTLTLAFGPDAERWLDRQDRSKGANELHSTAALLAADSILRARLEAPEGRHSMALVLQRCMELDLDIGTTDLTKVQKALRERGVQVDRTTLGMKGFLLLSAQASHGGIRDLITSATFLALPKEERFVAIVEKLCEMNVISHKAHLIQIHSGLPKEIKDQVNRIDLPLEELRALRRNLKSDSVRAFLESDRFKDLNKEGRFVELVSFLDEQNLLGASNHLGQIYSGLPKEIKDQVNGINLPLEELRALRRNLKSDSVREFLESDRFKDLNKEDRLVELVSFLDEQKLLGKSNNLGHIYSGLPKEIKDQVNRINLPLKEVLRIHAALKQPQAVAWIEEHLPVYPREERLQVLAHWFRQETGNSTARARLFAALPSQLSPSLFKRDLTTACLRLDLRDQTVFFDSGEERIVAQLLYRYGLISGFVEGENLHVKAGDSRASLDFKIGATFLEYHPRSFGDIKRGISLEEAGRLKRASVNRERYPDHEVVHIWKLSQLYGVLMEEPLNSLMHPRYRTLSRPEFTRHVLHAKAYGHKVDRAVRYAQSREVEELIPLEAA